MKNGKSDAQAFERECADSWHMQPSDDPGD
jgi:hypothetical protein